MSTLSSQITLEQAKTYLNKKVKYGNSTLTLINVREIDNEGKPMLLGYFKELEYPMNFLLLRDEDGKYIDEKLRVLSEDEETE